MVQRGPDWQECPIGLSATVRNVTFSIATGTTRTASRTTVSDGTAAEIVITEAMNSVRLPVYISRNSTEENCSAQQFAFDTPLHTSAPIHTTDKHTTER